MNYNSLGNKIRSSSTWKREEKQKEGKVMMPL